VTALAQTAHLTGRQLRALARQPWYIAITLVQPIIWLLLFGALFDRVTSIPGFTTADYSTFLTPGIVVMTALFSAGWSGMGIIQDLDRGIMQRMLVSPARRGALIASSLAHQGIVTLVQTVIILVLGALVGASYGGGAAGLAVAALVAVLLAAAFAALSNALALLIQREETVIAVNQFLVLPASFLSAAFMQLDLAPGWIQAIAKANPVNWAVEAARQALAGTFDLDLWVRVGGLAAVAAACALLATRAFRAYQRSV
jgi:ABC-2 type transport system permease protein